MTTCRLNLSQINTVFTRIVTYRWHRKNATVCSSTCCSTTFSFRSRRCCIGSCCWSSFRSWSSGSCRTITIVFDKWSADFNSCSSLNKEFCNFTRVRRQDFLHQFVVLYFSNRIIFFDVVSDFYKPVGDIAFVHTFTDIRHSEDLSIT